MTIDRAEAPIGLPPRVLRISRTTAVDRRSNSIHSGGPTRPSADLSVRGNSSCCARRRTVRSLLPSHLMLQIRGAVWGHGALVCLTRHTRRRS